MALTRYPGGKNGSGVYQRLISLMPPHRLYIEAFLGSGAVMRRKRPAQWSLALDLDPDVIAKFGEWHVKNCWPGLALCKDAVEWLRLYKDDWVGDELVYCDPPYIGESRSARRLIYRHELVSLADHAELLRVVTAIPAMVMISGYGHPLYDEALATWRRIEFTAQTRGGPAREVVWCNFPEPTALHDYRFLGRDFHDRGRIARKIRRWVGKLAKLPALERAAILEALR